MKKVVYNDCYGGFNISEECAKWLADRGNKECINMLGVFDRNVMEDQYFDGDLCATPRHDALLVMAVEALGSKLASGEHAVLRVRTLTDNKYFIDEYDGSESVVEPHTIEWITV